MIPHVLDERATVNEILANRMSLARVGDGEAAIAIMKADAPGQIYSPSLARRLREVIQSDLPGLLVAIPNLWNAPIPKHMRHNWGPWTRKERMKLYVPGKVYGSAFISRPDYFGDEGFGMPYWQTMRAIWANRPVLAVRGSGLRPKNLELFDTSSDLRLKACPPRDAWREHGRLLSECLDWAGRNRDGVVCLMAGPTATVLAHDLCKAGVQALDLGKAPRFFRKERAAAC